MIDAMAYDDGKWWRMNEVNIFVNNSGAMGFFSSLFVLRFRLPPHCDPIQKLFILRLPQMHRMNKRLVYTVWFSCPLCILFYIINSPTPCMKLALISCEIAYHWPSIVTRIQRSWMTKHLFYSFLPVIVVHRVCRECPEWRETGFEIIQ